MQLKRDRTHIIYKPPNLHPTQAGDEYSKTHAVLHISVVGIHDMAPITCYRPILYLQLIQWHRVSMVHNTPLP